MKTTTPEIPLIRPPSEWRSIFVRLTRGCKWNRCRFCGIYPHLGEPGFSVRSVDEIQQDIDLISQQKPRSKHIFFGDADPLLVGVENFTEIAGYLKKVLQVERMTCYARASTLWNLKLDDIARLADAGLNRVHIGLESGDDDILRFHRKGQNTRMIAETAGWLKKSGIEISYYVLLGLGGKDNWESHIMKTAHILNSTDPEYIRVRRLWLYRKAEPFSGPECPLWEKIHSGGFIPQTPEGSVLELKLLLENLTGISSFFTCDHANNYVRVSGQLMSDMKEMLDEVNDFLSLPDKERLAHYDTVGSQI